MTSMAKIDVDKLLEMYLVEPKTFRKMYNNISDEDKHLVNRKMTDEVVKLWKVEERLTDLKETCHFCNKLISDHDKDPDHDPLSQFDYYESQTKHLGEPINHAKSK